MSSKILYSAGNNTFFFESMKPDYEKSGAWPDDLVAVTNDMYEEFTGRPPEGKKRGSDESGFPTWIDVSEPTTEQLIALKEQKKKELAEIANTEIAWRQDAVDAGMATEAEITVLAEWKKYRVLLMRIDTSTATDIEWPAAPDGQSGKESSAEDMKTSL
ncbi:TPA: tail fiber assembly protein [Escherichia coli]|uniref:tail fiber assembly protein n=1 Tax=Escherichia coli TaxID=562 RepID=UPI00102D69EA|nr:tail fiber assembly protein [Escherichia coli]EEY6114355.1 tail fiber assembly protein [Escherichia coli]EFB2942616.1 tail fiber assembly protein [Escherichia coli]EHL7217930.1 tail fiber assembly protein [Escherichia coli]EIL3262865.1 tail fiber assembly protein [Escherichia coli]EJF6682266.1 tail fiber assembly protein [Escherichia coli]